MHHAPQQLAWGGFGGLVLAWGNRKSIHRTLGCFIFRSHIDYEEHQGGTGRCCVGTSQDGDFELILAPRHAGEEEEPGAIDGCGLKVCRKVCFPWKIF